MRALWLKLLTCWQLSVTSPWNIKINIAKYWNRTAPIFLRNRTGGTCEPGRIWLIPRLFQEFYNWTRTCQSWRIRKTLLDIFLSIFKQTKLTFAYIFLGSWMTPLYKPIALERLFSRGNHFSALLRQNGIESSSGRKSDVPYKNKLDYPCISL